MWFVILVDMDDKFVVGRAQMEGMVTDLQLAREKQQGFETWQKENGKSLSIEMSVQVLTTGFWPQYKVRPLPLRAELLSYVLHTKTRMRRPLASSVKMGLLAMHALASLRITQRRPSTARRP